MAREEAENRRQEIREGVGSRADRKTVLNRLQIEVDRVVRELLQSREEAARLRMRVVELEGILKKKEAGGEAGGLIKENRELRTKLERIESKTREMMRKLEAIEEG